MARKDLPASMEDLLSVSKISKRYGSTVALADVSFSVRRGEIHVLLGENGAGKSSIMKIIAGETTPDTGKIRYDGETLTSLTPAQARQRGIAMVHQELSVFDGLPVYENMYAGEFSPISLFSRGKVRKLASEKLAEFGLDIPVDALLSELSPSEKQIVEILRATAGRRKLIILDEPTSSLTTRETDLLLELLRRLRMQGVSSLFVSHRISEVRAIGDRITILRDGVAIETFENQGVKEEAIVEKLVGRSLTQLYRRREYACRPHSAAARISINFPDFGLHSMNVHAGEIHGVFGLDGSGAAAMSECLFGLRSSPRGAISVDGKTVDARPEKLLQNGVAYLSADRKVAGLFHRLSIRDNIATPHIGLAENLHRVEDQAFAANAEQAIKDYSIKVPNSGFTPSQLSGGNQQKVMLASCMGVNPRILIINEPTRGIDVGTKLDVHRIIIDFAARGGSVIVFSGELPELIALADRLTIMRSGHAIGTLTGNEITEKSAISMASRELTAQTSSSNQMLSE